MSSHIAKIEVYPDYGCDGSMDLEMPFSYSCVELNLRGYTKVEELLKDIKKRLTQNSSKTKKGCGNKFKRNGFEYFCSAGSDFVEDRLCPECSKVTDDDCIIICNGCGKDCEWDGYGLCMECHKSEEKDEN